MVEESVVEKVRNYADLVKNRFAVRKVILFGSFATGTQGKDSDIDVAVVMTAEPENILQVEAELFKLRRSIDLRIEPHLVDESQDLSGFYDEILKYGKTVYLAEAA